MQEIGKGNEKIKDRNDKKGKFKIALVIYQSMVWLKLIGVFVCRHCSLSGKHR
jgi:hypothetical protein